MRRTCEWLRRWRHSPRVEDARSRVGPPTYASMPLYQATACSGGAFVLRDAARGDDLVAINGWEAEVRKGQRIVLARGGSEGGYDDALRAALMHSQKALDLMSVRGSNDLVIKGCDEDHVIWWPEPGGLAVRIVTFAALGMDIPPVTLKVTDAAGNEVPPAAPPLLPWHESFRYFRLSQTTEDLFDAYRNAFLALESVLSDIAPQLTNARGRPSEAEGAWFKRALAQANKVVPFAPFAPPGSADPVQDLYEELHLETRSPMSHAKSGRKVLLPQNEAERQNVTASLRRLVGLYLRLAESHLAARRMGGMMMAGGFRLMFGRVLEGATVEVSDDESPFDGSDARPNPAGGKLVALAPAGGLDTSTPLVATRLWAALAADLAGLPFVRRVVATEGNHVAIVQVLEGRLDLGSASRLEVLVGTKGLNVRQPRERYSF